MLWESKIHLSEPFFNEIIQHPYLGPVRRSLGLLSGVLGVVHKQGKAGTAVGRNAGDRSGTMAPAVSFPPVALSWGRGRMSTPDIARSILEQ